MFTAAILVSLALGAAPVATSPVPVVRAEESSSLEPDANPTLPWGAALDVGLPSGIQLSPFIRPLPWLQIEASLAQDGAAFGLGGGATVGALNRVFTPTFSVSAGHFFRGDLAGKLSTVTGLSLADNASAHDFDFDHYDAQVGVLFGGARLQFYLRGGVSFVHTTLHDFAATLQEASGDSTLTADDPTLTAFIPSARAGMSFTF